MAIDLYWIPLGAGGRVVRFNGRVYEACAAFAARRPRRDLYHAALVVTAPEGSYAIEMTPVRDNDGAARGVVVTGPVGLRALGRLRLFRYEVRCWRDGTIPDLAYAVGGPVRVASGKETARRLLAVAPYVPTPVWGRDELRAGEMWNCNSVVAWLLTAAGVDTGAVPVPEGGRAPGWDAGVRVARSRGDLLQVLRTPVS